MTLIIENTAGPAAVLAAVVLATTVLAAADAALVAPVAMISALMAVATTLLAADVTVVVTMLTTTVVDDANVVATLTAAVPSVTLPTPTVGSCHGTAEHWATMRIPAVAVQRGDFVTKKVF